MQVRFSLFIKESRKRDCPAEINLDSTKIRIGLGTKDYDIYAMYSERQNYSRCFTRC